eukprot:TRINITY_DN15512_c1_g1_i2.p1 TRINITY_DN15512_c1_g1~~TRINITY_DN15512_c1_g1_i2.p1  ORF type:complete len:141 (-),score=3.05 TRINITY_DN15512_c1_g1_i2:94-516(-)
MFFFHTHTTIFYVKQQHKFVKKQLHLSKQEKKQHVQKIDMLKKSPNKIFPQHYKKKFQQLNHQLNNLKILKTDKLKKRNRKHKQQTIYNSTFYSLEIQQVLQQAILVIISNTGNTSNIISTHSTAIIRVFLKKIGAAGFS